MAASLEDHERRIAALERAAKHDQSIERAVAEIVATSEKRLIGKIDRLADRVDGLERRIEDSERRMTKRIEDSERYIVEILNERFDAVMDALDRGEK